ERQSETWPAADSKGKREQRNGSRFAVFRQTTRQNPVLVRQTGGQGAINQFHHDACSTNVGQLGAAGQRPVINSEAIQPFRISEWTSPTPQDGEGTFPDRHF